MAKKGFGKLMALATIAGAAAVGISYLKKYKSFNRELEEEFHDFEGDGDEEDFFDEEEDSQDGAFDPADDDAFEEDLTFCSDDFTESDPKQSNDTRGSRKYISLSANADELKLAAKDILAAAGEMAGAAKGVLKDTAVILTDTAIEAASAAKDAAQIARAKLSEKAESYRERQAEKEGSLWEEDGTVASEPCGSTKSEPPKEKGENGDPDNASAEITIEPEDDAKVISGNISAEAPSSIAGTAQLDGNTPDSTLEVVKPEEAEKTVSEAEPITIVEEELE